LGNSFLLLVVISILFRHEQDLKLARQELEKVEQEIAALDEQINNALSGIMA
jgi:hypothetical protein